MSDKFQVKKSILNAQCLQLFILLLISTGVYLNTLWSDFVYDDNLQIIKNHWIRNIAYLPEVFGKGVWGFRGSSMPASNYYRPVMYFIYMLDYRIFGLAPWGFHLVNVLLNAAVCMLIFFVAKRLLWNCSETDRQELDLVPFAVAVIFAVHPIHTEVVAWVACVPELSFTFFYLLSFYFYMGFQHERGLKNKSAVVFSVASFFIAMLSKEPAVTLPAVLFCYDYVIKKSKNRPSEYIWRYLPYFMAIAAYFALRFHALHGFSPDTPHWKLSAYQNVINIFPLFVKYLGKLALPLNLNAFYEFHPSQSVLDPEVLFGLAVTVVFFIVFLILLKRRSILSFGLIIIAVPLLPVLYIPAIGRNVFTERYLYLPVFGFSLLLCLLVVRTMARHPRLSRTTMVCILCLVVVYSGMTMGRNRIWKNDFALWSDTVRKSPGEAIPHNNLGLAYSAKGWVDKAINEYRLALKISPDISLAHYNLGGAYYDKGWVDRAIEEYQHALEISPDDSDAHNNLGLSYFRKGWVDRAIDEYQHALKIMPDDAAVHNNLGNSFAAKGMLNRAIEEHRAALKIKPDYSDARNDLAAAFYNLSLSYLSKGLTDEALDELRTAVKFDPNDPDFHNNLGIAYSKKGLLDKGIEEFRYSIKLKSDNSEAHFNLGHALMEKGAKEEAVKELEAAARLKPDDPEIRDELGIAYARAGMAGNFRK